MQKKKHVYSTCVMLLLTLLLFRRGKSNQYIMLGCIMTYEDHRWVCAGRFQKPYLFIETIILLWSTQKNNV
jgi:hypothetical protein